MMPTSSRLSLLLQFPLDLLLTETESLLHVPKINTSKLTLMFFSSVVVREYCKPIYVHAKQPISKDSGNKETTALSLIRTSHKYHLCHYTAIFVVEEFTLMLELVLRSIYFPSGHDNNSDSTLSLHHY